MSLHYVLVESKKIEMKQIHAIKKNTQIMYNLIDTLRDHWDISTLFLRFDDNIIMRSKRVDYSSFDDDESNDDDDDENDETQTKRQNEDEMIFEKK